MSLDMDIADLEEAIIALEDGVVTPPHGVTVEEAIYAIEDDLAPLYEARDEREARREARREEELALLRAGWY